MPLSDFQTAIQKNLSSKLLTPRFRAARPTTATPSWGCCYVASEALYHMIGRTLGYRPAYVKIGKNITHWFLVGPGGNIIDLTADQFGDRKIPYKRARRSGFLTRLPSKRAEKLMVLAGGSLRDRPYEAVLYLTRRNLQSLINKLDRNKRTPDASQTTLIKQDTVHPKYPCTDVTRVIALEDEDYYTDRTAGEVHPADVPK